MGASAMTATKPRADLPRYLRAARRKAGDPEAILQTAAGELEPRQLARLISALRETHETWKVSRPLRDPLIDALLDAGFGPSQIAGWLGCNRKTVQRRTEARAEALEPTPTNRMNKRSECPKIDPRVSLPILSFDASSGAHMTPERQAEILAALGR